MLNVTQKKSSKCSRSDYFFCPVGIFRRLRWYLQLLFWKQRGKEGQLVGGSCLLGPPFYKGNGEIKALTEERIFWCLVLDAELKLWNFTSHTRGSWLCPPLVLVEVMWLMSKSTGWWQPHVYMLEDSTSISLKCHLSLRNTNALWVGLSVLKPRFSDDRSNIQSLLV